MRKEAMLPCSRKDSNSSGNWYLSDRDVEFWSAQALLVCSGKAFR